MTTNQLLLLLFDLTASCLLASCFSMDSSFWLQMLLKNTKAFLCSWSSIGKNPVNRNTASTVWCILWQW